MNKSTNFSLPAKYNKTANIKELNNYKYPGLISYGLPAVKIIVKEESDVG